MYSQNDEKFHISRFFGGFTGRFLDVGAHDGLRHSNTRRPAQPSRPGIRMSST